MQSILVYTHASPAGIPASFFKKAVINYSRLERVPYGITHVSNPSSRTASGPSFTIPSRNNNCFTHAAELEYIRPIIYGGIMRVIMCAEKTREQASDKRIYSHLSSIEHAPFSLSMMYIYIRVEKSCSWNKSVWKVGFSRYHRIDTFHANLSFNDEYNEIKKN